MVAINIWSVRDAALGVERLRKPVAWLASVTFTLYLAHFPLLAFWSNVLPGQVFAFAIVTLACVLLLASMTERQRPALKAMARRLTGVAGKASVSKA